MCLLFIIVIILYQSIFTKRNVIVLYNITNNPNFNYSNWRYFTFQGKNIIK